LEYVRAVFKSPQPQPPTLPDLTHHLPINDPPFFKEMSELYAPSYLQLLSDEAASDREAAVWLKGLYLNTKIVQLEEWMGK
jgi:hypothetical protein